MDLFAARQPIFNRDLRIYGYELLYRSGLNNAYSAEDHTNASLQVINSTFFSLDIARVVSGGRAFVNFTRELLLSEAASVISPQLLVVEVLEDIAVDEEVLAACTRLRGKGYLLAADDIVSADQGGPLLDLVDFIKVDFRLASPAEQLRIVERFSSRATALVAEKVETRAEFERARDMGYTYFQGYFFAKPSMLHAKQIPGFKMNYLRILNEVHRSEIDFLKLERLIRQEVSLTYKLLRYANSALFAQRAAVDSIKRSLVVLGEHEIRKWLSVVLMMNLTVDKPDALVMYSMIRASFCESLAQLSGLSSRKPELFLMGMLSLLDCMTDAPLPEALREIRLAPDICAVLLERDEVEAPRSQVGIIYSLVKAYERGEWQVVLNQTQRLRLDGSEVREAYLRAVTWCDEVFNITKPDDSSGRKSTDDLFTGLKPEPAHIS